MDVMPRISIFKLHDSDFVYCVVWNCTIKFHKLTLVSYANDFGVCNYISFRDRIQLNCVSQTSRASTKVGVAI